MRRMAFACAFIDDPASKHHGSLPLVGIVIQSCGSGGRGVANADRHGCGVGNSG
jgi:hypothetical protein